jgi:hypothetical protein
LNLLLKLISLGTFKYIVDVWKWYFHGNDKDRTRRMAAAAMIALLLVPAVFQLVTFGYRFYHSYTNNLPMKMEYKK